MNFSSPQNSQWYITKSYDNFSNIELIQVQIYEDATYSKLALKKDIFIGVFNSINELDYTMNKKGYENAKKLIFKNNEKINFQILHDNIYINNLCMNIFSENKSVNQIEVQFVKEDYRKNVIYNPKFLIVKRLNEIYTKTKNAFLDFTKEIIFDSETKLSKDKYLTVDLTFWNQDDKDLLFTNCF